jgi:hypothetical protein
MAAVWHAAAESKSRFELGFVQGAPLSASLTALAKSS